MVKALSVAIVLLLWSIPAQAVPIWPEPPGCNCSWVEVVPPPNMDDDPPQTAEEYLIDLGHEPDV